MVEFSPWSDDEDPAFPEQTDIAVTSPDGLKT